MNPKFLGQLAKYCKSTLKVESISVVTNSSKETSIRLQEYGNYIHIMAVSCDSLTKPQISRSDEAHASI